jgi:putative ABC transport system permease protein
MIRNIFKTAIRNILKYRIYTTINIVGLAIGLAACMILFMWVNYHLSFDMFHAKADRICRPILDVNITGLNPSLHCGSTGIMAPALKNDYPEIEAYVRLFRIPESARIRNGDVVQNYWEFYYSDPAFFDIFSFEFKFGDPKTALLHPGSMVLTEEAAWALFGDVNPVGNYVDVGGKSNYKITAVLKKLPANSHIQFQILTSYDQAWLADHIETTQYEPDFHTYLLLRPGTNIEHLNSKLQAFIPKYFQELASQVTIFVQPLTSIHLYSAQFISDQFDWRSVDIAYIYVFSAIALLILLIAGINYINLATARARRRAREVGIRKTSGASRMQLMLQFLGESVILSLLAMLLGYLLIELGMPLLNTLFDYELQFGQISRLHVFSAMVLLALLVGLVTGWYPALVLSLPKPQNALKLSGDKGVRGLSLRRVLVVIQFFITMILVIFSFTINKQLAWIQNKNLGFHKEQVITFRMPAAIHTHFKTIKNELLQNSWISEVSAMGPKNFPGLEGKRFEFEGQVNDAWWSTPCSAVDFDFVRLFGLKIVEGRDFSESMETDKYQAYIINETLKKQLGWETAVGKKFWIPEQMKAPGSVIGVVKDFNWRSLHESVTGIAFFIQPEATKYIAVRALPEHVPALMDIMHRMWQNYAPNATFEHFFVDELYARLYISEQKTRRIINAFSILAMFIACLGLLGLIAFSTELRKKEIGIRKVLGSSIYQILVMLSKEFIVLLCLAAVFAWPAAWYITSSWLENFAYRTTIGLGVFIFAWMITLIIALLTMAGQVLQAARANPIEALRYE